MCCGGRWLGQFKRRMRWVRKLCSGKLHDASKSWSMATVLIACIVFRERVPCVVVLLEEEVVPAEAVDVGAEVRRC